MSDSRMMPAAAGEPRWRDPAIEPPPRGKKLLLLTSGGIACIGDWQDDSNLTHWSPLPRRPANCERCGKPAGRPGDLHTCTPTGKDCLPVEPVAYGVRPVVPQQGREFSWAEIEEYEGMAEAAAQDLEAKYDRKFVVVPLYTASPARQPLTDEQIQEALSEANVPELPDQLEFVEVEIARAIERAHGIGVDA